MTGFTVTACLAVNKRLALEATESRRAADEAAAVRRGLASLQNELNKSRQETLDARERLRQEVTDSDRRMAQADLQMNDMAQQIKVGQNRQVQLGSGENCRVLWTGGVELFLGLQSACAILRCVV